MALMQRWVAMMLAAGLLASCVSTSGSSRGGDLQAVASRIVDEVWADADFTTAATASPGSAPEINRLTAAMAARFPQLQPLYDDHRVGLTRDGFVAIPALAAVPLDERNNLRELVADENADRSATYRLLAVAAGDRWQEPMVRGLFAGLWIERAKSGWAIQDADGAWINK